MTSKTVPLSKKSKKARRQYHAEARGSWNGVIPVTRRIPNRKKDMRGRIRPGEE